MVCSEYAKERKNEMSMQSLERAILIEAKEVIGNKKLRMKDIMEWSTSEVVAQPGEKLYFLPAMKVNIAVPKSVASMPKEKK